MTEFPQMDSSLVVPVFNQRDDPIACLNKAMAFLTDVASSRQGQSYAGTSYKGNATSSGENNTGGQTRVVKCYNCQGEGHMAKQCTQPKRPRNAAWFKEKTMLVETQEFGQILDAEQQAFLADPGILNGQTAQTTIPNTVAFQTEDLDAYYSDCDDVSNAKAVLMANLSNYDSIIPLGQKNTLAEYMILSGAENRPLMLDKDLYDSWKSRMELHMQNREHERMILESVKNGPLIWPTVEENGVTKIKKYAKLFDAEKIQADCDMKATNIILQGLPADIYSLERESKLYDAFDKFTYIKGESHHNLPPERSKFVTDVKLVKDLNTTNFDQLHAYLEQHELHVNEVRIMRECNQDPLAFVANQQMTPPHFNNYQSSYNNPQLQQQLLPSQYGSIHCNQHYSSTYPSQPQFNHSSVQPSYPYQSQMNH
ncbi:integrase, catalytic region, zinc finger, CCHC-type containing protein [Tanacetum coccineum]